MHLLKIQFTINKTSQKVRSVANWCQPRSKSCNLHWPGIEPGPPTWQARILPLNHQCLVEVVCITRILMFSCHVNFGRSIFRGIFGALGSSVRSHVLSWTAILDRVRLFRSVSHITLFRSVIWANVRGL